MQQEGLHACARAETASLGVESSGGASGLAASKAEALSPTAIPLHASPLSPATVSESADSPPPPSKAGPWPCIAGSPSFILMTIAGARAETVSLGVESSGGASGFAASKAEALSPTAIPLPASPLSPATISESSDSLPPPSKAGPVSGWW